MNRKLLLSCVALWALGLLGMWIARAVLELEPAALPFQVAARLWFVGGVGYTGLGLLHVASARRARVRRPAGSADLSLTLRRR